MSNNPITGAKLISKPSNKAFDEGYDLIFKGKKVETMDRSMGITNTEYCSAGRHYVKSEDITYLEVGKTGRRKLCFNCKQKAEAATRAAKLEAKNG